MEKNNVSFEILWEPNFRKMVNLAEIYDLIFNKVNVVLKNEAMGDWSSVLENLKDVPVMNVETLAPLIHGVIRDSHRELCSVLLRHMTNMSEFGTVLDAPLFIRGINAALNLGQKYNIQIQKELEEQIVKAARVVLKLYPSAGYDPLEDEFFMDKMADGSLDCTNDLLKLLREEEVVVEENYRIIHGLRPKP